MENSINILNAEPSSQLLLLLFEAIRRRKNHKNNNHSKFEMEKIGNKIMKAIRTNGKKNCNTQQYNTQPNVTQTSFI